MKSEILVSITGKTSADWKNKLSEINSKKIKRIALFVEFYKKLERKKIYEALLNSCVKEIPFVHARHDMDLSEYKFLMKNFKTKYFNLHLDGVLKIEGLGLHKIKNKILYEHSFHSKMKRKPRMDLIGGFCIDLSHFKSAEERWSAEFEFVLDNRKKKKLFIANHLNGFSYKRKRDLHTIRSHEDFNYLRSLPEFVFGKYIALETFNSIEEQLEFRRYIKTILKDKIKLK